MHPMRFVLPTSLLLTASMLGGWGPASTLTHHASSPQAISAVHAAPVLSSRDIQGIESMHFLSSRTGWITEISNGQCSVLSTSNGGMTWSRILQFRLTGGMADGTVHLFNVRDGFVLDAGAKRLYVTHNDGVSWSHYALPTVAEPSMISFPNMKSGWILGNIRGASGNESALLYHSSDGGASWSVISRTSPTNKPHLLPVYGDKFAIVFKNAYTGWVAGSVNTLGFTWLYGTHDGGYHWDPQMVNEHHSGIAHNSQIQLSTPMFTSSAYGFLPVQVDTALEIFKTVDGGKQWTYAGKLPDTSLGNSSIEFLNSETGWIATGNLLMSTKNGGKSWTPLSSFRNMEQRHIDFINGKIGWMRTGPNGQSYLEKTTDGGYHWNFR